MSDMVYEADSVAQAERLQAEVERLTAELAQADKLLRVHEATDDAKLAAAEAREAALRAIPDKFMVGGVTLSDAQLLVAIKSEMEQIQ